MIAWTLETLIATSLLMLLVLAVRAPIRRAFGPNIAYALWLLPAARMVLPPLPADWRGTGVAPLADASQQMIYTVVQPFAVMPVVEAEGASVPWVAIVAASWAMGAIGFIAYHWISHRRFCTTVRRKARSTGRVAQGRVEVIESDAANGPLAFGVFRKTVAFPPDFSERYDDAERDLALAHELGHHARGDLLANWFALLVLGLHWFNPVAWKAFRAFRADQEMACDALVLSGREPSLRHAYGRAIVKSAHGGAVSAACHLHTINDLKGRLKMLLDNRKRSRRRVLGGTAASVAIGLAALGATASGTQAAATIRTTVEERTGVDINDVKLPSLIGNAQETPVPPAPPAEVEAPAPPEAAPAPEPIAKGMQVYRTENGGRTLFLRRSGDGQIDEAELSRVLAEAGQARVDGARMAAEILENMPQVVEGNCGSDDPRATREEMRDGKRVITICKDRIARIALDGEKAQVLALSTVRNANASALSGLRMARRSVERQPDLTPEQRSQALAGIDQALRELQSAPRD